MNKLIHISSQQIADLKKELENIQLKNEVISFQYNETTYGYYDLWCLIRPITEETNCENEK